MITPIIAEDTDKETIVLSGVGKCILRKSARRDDFEGWIPKNCSINRNKIISEGKNISNYIEI